MFLKDITDRFLTLCSLFGEQLSRIVGSLVQLLHVVNIFILRHLLLEETDSVGNFLLAHRLVYLFADGGVHLSLGILVSLGAELLPVAVQKRPIDRPEVSTLVMPGKSGLDSRWNTLALLSIECRQQVSEEPRVEPVLGDQQLAVEVCDHSDLLGLLQELLHGALAASVPLVVQVVHIDLLVAALEVDHAGLHGDLGALLGVGLEGDIPDGELMRRVLFLRVFLGLALGTKLHLDYEPGIVDASSPLRRDLLEAIVLGERMTDHPAELLVVFIKLRLFCI